MQLRSRVRLVVYVLDPVFCYRQVHLSRRDVFVPHQLLQRFEICTVLEHMHRERSPDDIRSQLLVYACLDPVFLEDLPQPLSRDALSAVIYKECRFVSIVFYEFFPAVVYVVLECGSRRSSQRHDPWAALFAVAGDEAHPEVDVVHVRLYQLADSDAGRVEDLEYRPVSDPLHRIVRYSQKPVYLLYLQIVEFFSFDLRRLDVSRRIDFYQPCFDEIIEKRPH